MKWLKRVAASMLVAIVLCSGMAMAEGLISTNVVMRVSKMTQDAVVKAGEDLSIEVNVDGIEPSSYQWYFDDTAISGATQRVYNLVNAQEENAGVYRMDAYNADGELLLSIDIAARVISAEVPAAGDASMPIEAVLAVMGIAAVTLVAMLRRRPATR